MEVEDFVPASGEGPRKLCRECVAKVVVDDDAQAAIMAAIPLGHSAPHTGPMSQSATVIVPTHLGGPRLERLLESLAAQTTPARTIVVDNAAPEGRVAPLVARHEFAEHLRFEENAGFSRAVNAAAERSSDDALVLVNDDCVCEPRFVEELVASLDPAAGIVMSAGVLVDEFEPEMIDSAGIELDETLLGFDYLNGARISSLASDTPDPSGPCAGAAAFDRAAFAEVGGFDENLFAYWEDVDLALRLRRAGARCILASEARVTHEHSATLGSGSARKNYLMGFGRGYVLRKWSVLGSPARTLRVLASDAAVCAGQLVLDRTLAGVQGRRDGFAAAGKVPREPYPDDVLAGTPLSSGTLGRRLKRRTRLRKRRR
jgi:GT2 family glycosyltransferase